VAQMSGDGGLERGDDAPVRLQVDKGPGSAAARAEARTALMWVVGWALVSGFMTATAMCLLLAGPHWMPAGAFAVAAAVCSWMGDRSYGRVRRSLAA